MTTEDYVKRIEAMHALHNTYFAFRQSFRFLSLKYCACGCEQALPLRSPSRAEKQRFIRGHQCRGRPQSMEARRKKSLAQRGKPHPSMKGRRPWSAGSRLPMEVRAKISTTLIKTCNGPKIKEKMRVVQLKVQKTKPPTGLEIMVKNKLDDFGVRYERNKIFHDEGFGCVSDFYIPDRDLILEIDGCYWHGCVEPACVVGRRNLKIGLTPNQKRIIRRDEMKDTYYISKGHFVKRIWGHDVLSNCDETLRKAINDDIEVSIP